MNNELRNSWINLVSKGFNLIDIVFLQPKTKKILSRLLQNKTSNPVIIFDVGANTGQSVKFFRKIFLDSHIVCFEPNPSLATAIKNQNFDNVTVLQFALSNRIGKSNFYLSPLHLTSTLLLPDSNSIYYKIKSKILVLSRKEMYQPIEVDLETIDNLFLNTLNEEIDILKIDVEGAELHVLQGAQKVLSRKMCKVIQLERHHNDLRKDKFEEISDFLFQLGYIHCNSAKHLFGNVSEEFFKKQISPLGH